jgi:hypothetical protein
VPECGVGIPTTFNGTVTVDGAPAPDGTVITVLDEDGVPWGEVATSGGRYVVDAPESLPTQAPCFPFNGTMSFTADDVACAETGDATGGLKDLPLTCGAVATATPTVVPPTATVVVTATATPQPSPTALPPTGMGSSSEGGGFLWWPLALAAAALAAVAGLYTARRATR